MAEEVTQITRPSPIIEEAQKNYLTSLKDQVGTALDTSAFAPNVVNRTALDEAVQQQAATQAGLGTLSFDPTGAISGVSGSGVASYQPFLDTAQTTLGGVPDFITAAGQNFQTQTGNTQVTLNLRNYSNNTAASSSLGPFTVTSSTDKVDTRARARAIALKVENTGSGQDWKLGTFRLDIQPDGRR